MMGDTIVGRLTDVDVWENTDNEYGFDLIAKHEEITEKVDEFGDTCYLKPVRLSVDFITYDKDIAKENIADMIFEYINDKGFDGIGRFERRD